MGDTQRQPEPQKEAVNINSDATSKSGKAKKVVGFVIPEEELKSHHQDLKKIEDQKKKYNSFQKIPPELAYLEKKGKPDPKPLPQEDEEGPSVPDDPLEKPKPKLLKNFKKVHVKDISVINKDTELNFNFPTIPLPIKDNCILVSINYGGLNSWDISKLNKYYYNWSDTKVGLGFEFAGTVVDVGRKVKGYMAGDYVMGILNPLGRKGGLSSTIVSDLSRDVIVKVGEEVMEKLGEIDPVIPSSLQSEQQGQQKVKEQEQEPEQPPTKSFKPPKPRLQQRVESKLVSKKNINQYPVESTLPPLAKTALVPVLYSKAKQALQHLYETENPHILINGADTGLSYTIIQLLLSSLYTFKTLDLVLIVKEKSLKHTQKLMEYFKSQTSNNSTKINVEIVSFDLVNEDLVFPGEKVPINYKKPNFMVLEILGAVFKHAKVPLSGININDYKLDLIIDISGSHVLFSSSIKYKALDYLKFPISKQLAEDVQVSDLFGAAGPFFSKLLKPKSNNSSFISFCKFGLREPSSSIDKLIDYSTQANEQSMFNPWAGGWSSVANVFIGYNYHDEINLVTKRVWVEEGLDLVLNGELKFGLDGYVDWRHNFKEFIREIRRVDGKLLLKVEDF